MPSSIEYLNTKLRTLWWSRGGASRILKLRSRWRQVLDSRFGHFIAGVKTQGTNRMEDCMKPRDGLNALEKKWNVTARDKTAVPLSRGCSPCPVSSASGFSIYRTQYWFSASGTVMLLTETSTSSAYSLRIQTLSVTKQKNQFTLTLCWQLYRLPAERFEQSKKLGCRKVRMKYEIVFGFKGLLCSVSVLGNQISVRDQILTVGNVHFTYFGGNFKFRSTQIAHRLTSRPPQATNISNCCYYCYYC